MRAAKPVRFLLTKLQTNLANKRKLQPEQAAAAYEIKKHVSVTAGPGSGKTTVLVERYLHILREHKNLNIDQIVAITFTNRAANDMRERLRKDLDRILAECSDDERQRWMRFKRTLDGAVINTIHGFCALLLREFPVEARIDPEFLLLDAHDAAILLEAAVEETLTEFISSGRRTISELALGFGRSRLAEALVQLYWNIRGQGLSLAELTERTRRSHSSAADYTKALSDLTRVMEEFINFGRLTPAAESKRSQARKEWPELKKLIESNPASLADYCNSIENFRNTTRLARNSPVGNLVDKLDAQLWGAEKKGPLGLVPQICFDLRAQDYALEVIEVLKEVERRYREKKQSLAALDFEDLQLRALELLDQPAVLARATERYRFFLVDEFQDTNTVQRELMHKLTFGLAARANLFIVGDRKQSIYGFRGADVDVFQQTTQALKAAGGADLPLHLNFRSQRNLIKFFNYLFERLFQRDEEAVGDLPELGFVDFEASHAQRTQEDPTPVVELLIDSQGPADDAPKAQKQQAERDAKQVAQRILALTKDAGVEFRHIALLFRAMTDVPAYEATFRAANIPFQTVQGKGFYQREEISDLIQLLRFLDNKTDELALAAVLRSPLGGISDNALLALRCAPLLSDSDEANELFHFTHPRKLLYALRRHREIAYISSEERAQLDRADSLLRKLLERRNHYPIADLLRFAVEEAEYLTVIAANFDGAQKLANVRKLFTLAERFEHAGAHLVRDFVRYVEDFEAIGSREGEGQIDDSANAVRLMTIHQAKGLEFPVVIIPNLHHRTLKPQEHWYALDRHRGLTVKIPDGRGKQVAGCTLERFRARNQLREHFESVRLLYVAATRAQDRLILAGVTEGLEKLNNSPDNWLKLIWQKLELHISRSGVVDLEPENQLQVTLNSAADSLIDFSPTFGRSVESDTASVADQAVGSLNSAFPLLQRVAPEIDPRVGSQRLSVTQLINYQRCPRQYYFDRVLEVPAADQLAVWNNAEAPEPPANLNATLKGAVIHRFCETYSPGDVPEERLRQSFADVIRSRQAQLADRLEDINGEEALKELWPLAQNYLSSQVFRRVDQAEKIRDNAPPRLPAGEPGLWSELSFRLRRPRAILTGTIDKLLISPAAGGGFEIEIIDFKTNRIGITNARDLPAGSEERISAATSSQFAPSQASAPTTRLDAAASKRTRRSRAQFESGAQQFVLNFSETVSSPKKETVVSVSDVSQRAPATIAEQVAIVASDYQLQMQAYALAVQELLPDLISAGSKIKVTLHFLHPNIEWTLPDEVLTPASCRTAIDEAINHIISSCSPEEFPVRPARHCRMCSFLRICSAGRDWVRMRDEG